MPSTPAEIMTAPSDAWTELDPVRSTDLALGEERRRLKAQLHQQLVTNLDLSALGNLGQDRLRAEVRRMAEELCQRSSQLLSRAERDRLISEVLDETFGLGPLEALMRDPTVS